jgi:hypothetical protein
MMVMSVMVLVMRGRRNARIGKNQKCHRNADYLSHDSIPFLLLEFANEMPSGRRTFRGA